MGQVAKITQILISKSTLSSSSKTRLCESSQFYTQCSLAVERSNIKLNSGCSVDL